MGLDRTLDSLSTLFSATAEVLTQNPPPFAGELKGMNVSDVTENQVDAASFDMVLTDGRVYRTSIRRLTQ